MGSLNGVTAAAEDAARDRQDSKSDEFSDRRNATQAGPSQAATHHHRKTDRRRTTSRPTLAEPIEVKKFFANRKGDVVVIAIRQIEDGPTILDIRKFFTDASGITRP